MASKQTYPCFACRKAGFEVPVYLDGKDAEGHTRYLNEDGTRHQHKQAQQQQSDRIIRTKQAQTEQSQTREQQQSKDFHVSDESVDRGITAFSMMSSLIGLVEQNQQVLQGLEQKIDHLAKLVYALTEKQQQ